MVLERDAHGCFPVDEKWYGCLTWWRCFDTTYQHTAPLVLQPFDLRSSQFSCGLDDGVSIYTSPLLVRFFFSFFLYFLASHSF